MKGQENQNGNRKIRKTPSPTPRLRFVAPLGELIFTVLIAFILSGLLDGPPEADPQPSSPISNGNHSDDGVSQGRRYCDPPNMTALTAYYETSEEMNYDYDFLQNQVPTMETNTTTNDIRMFRRAIIFDWGLVFSFFPAQYLSAKFGPGKVFGYTTLALCYVGYAVSELKRDVDSFVIGFSFGSMIFTFFDMVFHAMSGSREILISFVAVKYVGVAICELAGLHETFAMQRYKFYTALIISIIWFFLWSKTEFWSSRAHTERRKKNLGVRTPWRNIFCSRPIWMTMFAFFAAGSGKACILLVMRMYLKSIYQLPTTGKPDWVTSQYILWLLRYTVFSQLLRINNIFGSTPVPQSMFCILYQVDKLSAFSNLLHFVFSIICGCSLYYLIKGGVLSVTTSRRVAVYLSHFLPAGMLFVLGFVGCGLITPMILYCLANVFTGANYSGVFSSPLDLAPTYSGPVLALCLTFGSLGSPVMNYLMYYILTDQALVSWRFIFSLNSLILLVTAILFMLRGSGSPQPWNDPEHRITKEKDKSGLEREIAITVPAVKPRTKSIYVVEKKILKVLHVQEPDRFTRVRAYSTSLPNERSAAIQPNIYRPSNKKRASIS